MSSTELEQLITKLENAKQELKSDGNRAIYAVVDEAIQALREKPCASSSH